jgi:hypothetical protein
MRASLRFYYYAMVTSLDSAPPLAAFAIVYEIRNIEKGAGQTSMESYSFSQILNSDSSRYLYAYPNSRIERISCQCSEAV